MAHALPLPHLKKGVDGTMTRISLRPASLVTALALLLTSALPAAAQVTLPIRMRAFAVNMSNNLTGANGILTLPVLTSYAEASFAGTIWRANGANSKIDLTSITSITGATGNLFIEAQAGGTVELDGLPSTTARDVNFTVDGATSVMNLSALTSASIKTRTICRCFIIFSPVECI